MNQPMTPEQRFWAKVVDHDGCRVWTGAKDARGYGVLGFDGRTQRAHRVAWALTRGEVPANRVVCHTCDNPPCCDPKHLFLGTSLDNTMDMQAKGRGQRRDSATTGREGRGHIRAYGRGGWRLHVYTGVDPITGKQRQKTKVVRGTRADAEVELTAMLAAADRSYRNPGTAAAAFGDVLVAFLEHKAVSLEATTLDTYRHQLAFIPDRLKAMPVGKVQVEHLETLYAQLRRAGRKRDGGPMSAKSVRSVHQVIHGALELARRRKWILENPAADAEVPADKRREPTPTPADSIGRIIRAAATIHPGFPAYVRLSACAGGRRSEVHGLRWSGINWERRRVTIRDVIVHAEGAWITKPYPKTGGQRCVTVDPGTLEALRQVHATALDNALACGIALPDRAFVFSDEIDGSRPWVPRTTAKWFRRACAAAGVDEGTRVHDLRHLMATHLVDEGLPLPAVSARMGHASPSITLDVYSGRVPRSDEVAADIMGRLLDG